MKAKADQTIRKCAREHRTMAVEVAVERYLTVHLISKVSIKDEGAAEPFKLAEMSPSP